jgi:Phytanoyl-CoA dioxygenase (PhyH)
VATQTDTGEQPIHSGLDTLYEVTEEQVAHLYQKGWTRLPGLVDPKVATLISERLRNEPIRPRSALTASFRQGAHLAYDPRDDSNLPVEPIDDEMTTRNHDGLAWRVDFFRQLGTSTRLGGTAAQLMRRPEVLFVQDMSFLKPGPGRETVMHQDYPHWPIDRKGMITIWIALTEIDETMAPLQYLEGSHLQGPLGRTTGGKDIREEQPDLTALPVGGGGHFRPGDAQAHLDLTVHGSLPNTSSSPREAYLVRYMPPETIYTGIGHPHYDQFELQIGSKFAANPAFPHVSTKGLIAETES